MNTSQKITAALLLAGGAAAIAVPALSQKSDPPIARYTIDASTTSGLMAMGAGGGNVMSILRGGGSQQVRQLDLRLGSTRAPTGAAKGDHFMPAGAGLGKSVPLATPAAPGPRGTPTPGVPDNVQMPKARLYLFWGCGETAPKGQPVVIDFSKLAQGQVPPNLFAQAVNLPDEWSVTTGNSRTFGDWPNSLDKKTVPANSSLLGAHKITSSYAPEINFTLADDFMPALQLQTRDMPSGAVNLSWVALPKATGYYSWVIGSNPEARGDTMDMVWWSSSATQMFGGVLSDWLSPAAVRKLVDAKSVMPPSQTSCAIPKEVKQQTGGGMLMTQLYAYGPQADFAYPPRPTAANAVWKPEWIARARFRAQASVIHGMPGLGGAMSSGDEGAAPEQPAGKPKCPGGLRGIGMRAAGLCE